MSDFDDTTNPPVSEGVRILGAQEAIAFEETQDPATTGEIRHADVARDAPNPEHARPELGRPEPAWNEGGPSWTAAERHEPSAGASGDPSATAAMPAIVIDSTTAGGAPELPHWSEPPTGQIPAVFVSDSESASGATAESAGDSGPRFRSDSENWSDADFAAALARDDDDDLTELRLGDHEPILDAEQEDAAFVAAVRARRRAGTRAVVTSTPEARPRPATTGRRPNPPRRSADVDIDGGDMLPVGAAGRDLSQAIFTAFVFGAIALICFKIGVGTSAFLCAIVLGMCAFELCNALQSKGLRPATVPVVIGCAVTPMVALRGPDVVHATAASGFASIAVIGTLVTVTSMLWFLFKAGPGRAVVGVATSLLTFAYVGGLGGYAGMLLQRGKPGITLLLGTVLCVVAYDAVGYFAGSKFGNARIAPEVSPNKSVEGTVGGVLGAALVGALLLTQMSPWNDHHGVAALAATGFLIGVAALLGDLCESMLKRDLGVKDFGSVLPGHGGFLDRFDGLLFALPVAYFITMYLNAFLR